MKGYGFVEDYRQRDKEMLISFVMVVAAFLAYFTPWAPHPLNFKGVAICLVVYAAGYVVVSFYSRSEEYDSIHTTYPLVNKARAFPSGVCVKCDFPEFQDKFELVMWHRHSFPAKVTGKFSVYEWFNQDGYLIENNLSSSLDSLFDALQNSLQHSNKKTK